LVIEDLRTAEKSIDVKNVDPKIKRNVKNAIL